MPIVSDGQLNLGALTVDDLYIVVVPPQTPIIAGVPTDGIGIVGTAASGPINTPVPVSTVQDLLRNFGDVDTSQYDLVTEALGALKQGANNLWCIRVSDGSDVKAIKVLTDPVATIGVSLSAKYTGSYGTNLKAQLGVGSSNTAAYGTATITIGAVTAGQAIVITINSVAAPSYTITSTDTPTTVALAIANLIRNGPPGAYVTATVAGPVINLRALAPGTVGNYTLAKSGTGSASATLSGATFTGGTGVATWRLVLSGKYDVPEIFDNITVGTFATIWDAITDAVNNGIAGVRGASNLATAVGFSIPGTPVPQIAAANTAGTDGRAGITSGMLIGVDGFTRTGMYSLRGLPIAQFGIAGLTDTTQWSAVQLFAKDENMVTVLAFQKNLDSISAVQTKNTLGATANDYRVLVVKDSLWINDTFNSLIRQVSPVGCVLGKIATLSPERSPGNKPVYGYLGAEHTSYVNASGALVPAIPFSYAEMSLLETSGIMFFTQPAVGGNYLALRHGQNSSSNPTINGINYSRMTNFLSRSLQNAMGFAVGEPHTRGLRDRVKASLSQFLSSLANPGPGRGAMIGDPNGGPAYSVVCDESNNPANLIAQGYLFAYVQVKYLSIVRFFVLSIEAGQSVNVTVQSSQPLNR